MTAMDGGNAGSAGACAGLMYDLYTLFLQALLPTSAIAPDAFTILFNCHSREGGNPWRLN